MSKLCFHYDPGEYEDIDKEGSSYTQGGYVYHWDESEYRRKEEEERQQEEDNW